MIRTFGVAVALAAAVACATHVSVSDAEAKTPGTTYCFNEICHRVLTLPTTAALIDREIELETSFYDGCKFDVFNPCGLTSSGEVFRPWSPDNAASPVYPDGTTLLVYNPDTKVAAVVRVNNAGPYWGRRKLDVSRATAEKLGFRKRGIAKLKVMVIGAPTVTEASYRRRRAYDTVPGPIGEFASMDDARRSIAGLMMNSASRFAGMRTSPIATGSTNLTGRDEERGVTAGAGLTAAALGLPTVIYSGAARDPLESYRAGVELAAAKTPSVEAATAVATGEVAVLPAQGSMSSSVAITVSQASVVTAVTAVPEAPLVVAAVAPAPAATAVADTGEATARGPMPVRVAAWTSADVGVPAASAAAKAMEAQKRIQPFKYSLEQGSVGQRPIEIAVTRRLDTVSPANEMQSVLRPPSLDVAAEMMEKDLSSARISLFSSRVRLTSLTPAPVGRLAQFAKPISPVARPADELAERRVSLAVRWARMQLTGATSETTP